MWGRRVQKFEKEYKFKETILPNLDFDAVLSCLKRAKFPNNESNPDYHAVFFHRYFETIKLIKSLNLKQDLRVLELAANPYGLTVLLKEFCFRDLTLANYGDSFSSNKLEFGEHFTLVEYSFDAERDAWPFENETFDLVLCCEMLEHLPLDPMNIFSESNRVLSPGGHLLVSTPNASCIQNVYKLLNFETLGLAPHFRSDYRHSNIYLRHNREYTPKVLEHMFASSGFEKVQYSTSNSYPLNDYGSEFSQEVLSIFDHSNLRGDTLNFVGKKISKVLNRYPQEHDLYLK
jgi:ubiquinone/menaquinone biosynthesis C-methylase UbiE